MPDERTAPTVKRIFDLYTREQLGTAAVARVLADEHAPAPAAGWQPAVVQWVLENEAYLGRVIWRGESLPGLHEPLVDEFTFARAQRLLRERGDDMALRRSNPGDYLLSGLLRCGRCKRAYVGMSAKGNGGTYHYYACSGRQKLGPKGCDGERISARQTRSSRRRTAHLALPRRRRDPRRNRRRGRAAAIRRSGARRTATRTRRGDPAGRTRTRPLLHRLRSRRPRRQAIPDAHRRARNAPRRPARARPRPRRPARPTGAHNARRAPTSPPSPTNSKTWSAPATPSRQRRSSVCSSKTSASTAAARSCRPTASSRTRFAHCQVQWARLGSNQRPLACEASALPLSYAP